MEQCDKSDISRKELKMQLNEASDKIIVLEEELFAARQIQNELLEELKGSEDKLQTAIDEAE